MKEKRKRLVLVSACILALVVVGGILAYYTAENAIDNQLQTQKYGNELIEQFTPKGDWQPGMAVNKKVSVQNTGDYNLFVRIWMEEDWILASGATKLPKLDSSKAAFTSATAASATQVNAAGLTDGLTTGDETVVFKKLNEGGSTNWVKGTDGYWYWKVPLTAGQSTTDLLEQLTLAANTDMGLYETIKYYTTMAAKPAVNNITSDPATGWVKYTGDMPATATFNRTVSGLKSGNEGYAGAKYVLTIKSQVLQGTKEAFDGTSTWSSTPDEVKTSWGV